MSGPFGATPWMYDHTDFYPLDINQSLKFNDNETQYLSWTPASAGNRKTWTWSGWVKRGNLGLKMLFTAGTSGTSYVQIRFDTNDEILCASEQPALVLYLKTTQKFRDPSAWYHIVVAMDTTQLTAADRTKLYINGSLVTDFSSSTRPAQNTDLLTNSTTAHMIGALSYGVTSGPYDGYLSDIYFIDGQALAPENFGEFKEGIWIPKIYNGTYGSNGFHLPFKNDDTVEGFNAVTYRGNDATNRISGLGFSPDLVWLKNRDVASTHRLYNSLTYGGPYDAGVAGSKYLASNSNAAETTGTANSLISLDADGFSVHGSGNDSNDNGEGYVAWCWDAGSGSAVSNTDGSITSTVKANTDYGFSIVNYVATGANATIGHGLGVKPDVVIVKNRDTAGKAWPVYHSGLGGAYFVYLNQTDATQTFANAWNATEPTSSVFSIGTSGNTGGVSGDNYIAYCFNSVAGYSSFGSYTGTGASGNSITGLGFRPAWLMVKLSAGGTGGWIIWDNTRDTNDADVDNPLFPNLTNAEFTSGGTYDIQFDSDGFTINNTSPNHNGSGNTYIYMAFADTRDAAFWWDTSGNNNNWTPNNLDYRDSLPDSTTNNFATMNSVEASSGVSATLSEGNLKTVGTTVSYSGGIASTFEQSSGKWYWEVYVNSEFIASSNFYNFVGAATGDNNLIHKSNNSQIPSVVAGINGWSWEGDGTINLSGTGTKAVTSVTAPNAGDVLGFAIDLDNGDVYFYHNGTAQNSGNAVITGVTGLVHNPMVGVYNGSTVTFNFGQDSTFSGATTAGGNTDANGIGNFKYAPPAGYLALCTANLPTPSIVDGSEHFNTVLWTGNGANSRAISGVGFSPDFVWAKQRSQAISHVLYDSVRGAGNDKELYSNSTLTEGGGNADQYGYLSSFDSDGFTGVDGTGSPNYYFNENNQTFVAWNWKAGGTAVSNTDGSITSQVSANTDMGFSIISYQGNGTAGASIGHGLSSAPELIICKNRTAAQNWLVQGDAIGDPTAGNFLLLESTAAKSSNNTVNTTLGASTITLDTSATYNGSGNDHIIYAFHSSDVIKAGSYTGNGSTDGPFVYTGFRPAWVMFKRSDIADSWFIADNKRNVFNPLSNYLFADLSNAENSVTDRADFLSNGFKVLTANGNQNASGGTYIYLAFAENPFKYSNAR